MIDSSIFERGEVVTRHLRCGSCTERYWSWCCVEVNRIQQCRQCVALWAAYLDLLAGSMAKSNWTLQKQWMSFEEFQSNSSEDGRNHNWQVTGTRLFRTDSGTGSGALVHFRFAGTVASPANRKIHKNLKVGRPRDEVFNIQNKNRTVLVSDFLAYDFISQAYRQKTWSRRKLAVRNSGADRHMKGKATWRREVNWTCERKPAFGTALTARSPHPHSQHLLSPVSSLKCLFTSVRRSQQVVVQIKVEPCYVSRSETGSRASLFSQTGRKNLRSTVDSNIPTMAESGKGTSTCHWHCVFAHS